MMELNDDILNPKRFVIMTLLFMFREMTESDLAKASKIGWGFAEHSSEKA